MVRGHDEVLALWRQFAAVWTRLVFEPEEIVADDGSVAIVRVHVTATGGESGVDADRVIYYVMGVRDGLLARIVPHDTLAEAAATAGLATGAE